MDKIIANGCSMDNCLRAADDLGLAGGVGGAGGNVPEPTEILYSPAIPVLFELSRAKSANVYL